MLAGYLPIEPEVISAQLLDLLADGEAVLRVPGSPYYILWRKAMLDPSWSIGCVLLVCMIRLMGARLWQ